MGAYFPLPILVSDLFPQLEVENIGPPPECAVASITELATAGTAETIPKLQDPETGEIDFSRARADHTVDVHNLAVGGSNLRDVIDRPSLSNVPVNFITRLVYEPFGGLFERITETQLDRVDVLKPTLVFSTDLYGNDLIAPFVNADVIDVELATPLEEMEADLVRVVARLAATGAYVFLGNLPAPNLLPVTSAKRTSMLAAVEEEARAELAAEIDTQIDEIVIRAAACNDALQTQADLYPNVFVVDLAIATKGLAAAGLTVGDQHLNTGKFGGLLGLDGIHFTDTGYALIANLFLNAINKELGVDIPYVDFHAILERDMESPKNLKAQGVDGSLCD